MTKNTKTTKAETTAAAEETQGAVSDRIVDASGLAWLAERNATLAAETKTETTETRDAADETIDPRRIDVYEKLPGWPPPPRLESYIRQHDETQRALATVRLEGGGAGDGTYLVDTPVPRSIGHRAERYVLSRTEPGVSVYIWVNR